MLIRLSASQALLVEGAMRRVATAGGTRPLSDADRRALLAFDRFVLRRDGVLAVDALPAPSAAEVAAAVPAPGDRDHVVQFLIVMALVDGTVDAAKIDEVDAFAQALSVREDAVRQLAEVGRGHLAWVRADVARRNLHSITGHDVGETIDAWILPYRARADPALAARYRALADLPEGTLGRTFCEFYRANGFAFAGEPGGLNQRFASPHDATHILSGYDTTPQGELLVSTFTAGMHPKDPMSGHILPVILSWHLGIELAKLPGEVKGQLDPVKFWNAWERGSQVAVDVFADEWNFWSAAREPLSSLRVQYRVPPLDPEFAAGGDVPPWYRPVA
ncbi:MAG: hypothetical protein U1F15_11365 [Burkholderiales bacterium]